MSWGYGTLVTEVYELDKPIGHSFGDVEYYLRHLAGVTGRILEPTGDMTGAAARAVRRAGLSAIG